MLTPNEQIVLRTFAENLKADIQDAIRKKPVTQYGAVNSSGRLVNSIEIVYTDNGFQILANAYIDTLINGRRPGKFPPVSVIRRWIDEKPITSDIPKDTLAFLIARKISREGNLIWRIYKGQNSGLLTDALSNDKFDNFVELFASRALTDLTYNVYESFELITA